MSALSSDRMRGSIVREDAAVRYVIGGFGETLQTFFDFSRGELRENLTQAVSVDDLADQAGMSRAVFPDGSRRASPLQFIKVLRLSHAAMQIVAGEAVSQAAEAVGYTSASQFSREFRRHFGESPRKWAKTAASSVDVQATRA